jgi:hypothetical protein
MRPDPRALKLRRVPHNHPALRALHDACFVDGEYKPTWSAGTWWIVWLGDKPVAFAGVTKKAKRRTWELSRSGVVKSARGLGLQRRLIRARERFVRSHDPGARIVSYTMGGNVPSSNNLFACGYRLYDPGRHEKDVLNFERRLTPRARPSSRATRRRTTPRSW